MQSLSKYELLQEKYKLNFADFADFCNSQMQHFNAALQNKDVITMQNMLAEHQAMQAEFVELKVSLRAQINKVNQLKLYTQ
jgi:hypothetical protein